MTRYNCKWSKECFSGFVYGSGKGIEGELDINDWMALMLTFVIQKNDMMREERYNPYKPLTSEKIIERLVISRKHAEEGKVMPAHQVSANIRKKWLMIEWTVITTEVFHLYRLEGDTLIVENVP